MCNIVVELILSEADATYEISESNKVIRANIMTIAMIQECKMLLTMPTPLRELFDKVVRFGDDKIWYL